MIDVLKASKDRDLLAHAYIISGPKFVGKKIFLESVLKIVFNDESFSFNSIKPNLNLQQIDLGSEDISVENVRNFVHMLTLGGIGSGYKVGVIFNANLMSAQSSNALLKFLEEPTKKTILFLVVDSYMNLIETIRSRAINIKLKPIDNLRIASFLKEKYPNVEDEKISIITAYSSGLIDYADKLLQDEAKFDIIKEDVAKVLKNLVAPTHIQKEYIDSIEKEDFDNWLSIFKVVVSDLLSVLSENPGLIRCLFAKKDLEVAAKKISLEKVEGLYKKLSEFPEQSVYNLSHTLFIESLFYLI